MKHEITAESVTANLSAILTGMTARSPKLIVEQTENCFAVAVPQLLTRSFQKLFEVTHPIPAIVE